MTQERERFQLIISLGEGKKGQDLRKKLKDAAKRTDKLISVWARDILINNTGKFPPWPPCFCPKLGEDPPCRRPFNHDGPCNSKEPGPPSNKILPMDSITTEELHEADLLIPCPAVKCRAKAGAECKGLPKGQCHFGRRLRWVLATVGGR
jgi:hypothetical protein